MQYNFDEVIDRRGTDSIKWDGMEADWGRSDLQAMWVADMDFRTPPFVVDSVRSQLDAGVLGYTRPSGDWAASIARWQKSRHNLEVAEDEILFLPGIVRGIAFAVNCFTKPGDKVMVMPPVYHPFFLVTQKSGREVAWCPLQLRDEHIEIDFDLLERLAPECRMLILCNPHNPGGRVWTADELRRIASICRQHHVTVISDEIHADLTLPRYCHHAFPEVSDDAAACCVMMGAPSKTFNMPGLSSSYAIVKNPELRRRFAEYLEAEELNAGNMFAYRATAAAYNQGAEWLTQLLEYIDGNIQFTKDYLQQHIPSIGMIEPQASFLVFLDCRKLGLDQQALNKLFVEGAHLALNSGDMFGKEGTGFMRLNVGCPRSQLQAALDRLKAAL